MSVLLAVLLLLQHTTRADNWPRFRGPNGSGVSDQTVPATWTEANVRWRASLPGEGHSSPVVWNDTVYVMSAEAAQSRQSLIALEAHVGNVRWQIDRPLEDYSIHVRSSYASSTPCVDDQAVYVAWTSPTQIKLTAIDHQGRIRWEAPLGSFACEHGFGSSPIAVDDLVILPLLQMKPTGAADQEPTSRIVAIDRNTGEIRWSTPRKSEVASYSVPCVYSAAATPQLICCDTANGMYGLNLSSGEVLWSLPVFDKRTVSSLVTGGSLLFGSTGSGGGGNYVVALRPDPMPAVAYKVTKQAPYVPTLVCHQDRVYLWSDNGIVTCLRRDDGEKLWQERIGGNFSGSPIIAGNRLYCVDDDGTVVVVSATDRFELLGKTPLGEPSRSTPAVANGSIYFRTYSHLIAIGGEKP